MNKATPNTKAAAAAAAKAAQDAHKKQVQLLAWPEPLRDIPNAVMRGALFTASDECERFTEMTLIASAHSIEIYYLGKRLNQDNLEIWEMLLHFAKLQPLNSEVRFTAQVMLKALGRDTGDKGRMQLRKEISEFAGRVEIRYPIERKGRRLIVSYAMYFFEGLEMNYFDDEYVVRLSQRFREIYAAKSWAEASIPVDVLIEHGQSHTPDKI